MALPIRTQRGSIYHLTDDLSTTRCGQDCRYWWIDGEWLIVGLAECRRCGSPSDFEAAYEQSEQLPTSQIPRRNGGTAPNPKD